MSPCIICLEHHALIRPCTCQVIFHITCLMQTIQTQPMPYKCVMCRQLPDQFYIHLITWINNTITLFQTALPMLYFYKKNIIHVVFLFVYLHYLFDTIYCNLLFLNFLVLYQIAGFITLIYVKHRHVFNYIIRALYHALKN